jgi:hypothetical protein
MFAHQLNALLQRRFQLLARMPNENDKVLHRRRSSLDSRRRSASRSSIRAGRDWAELDDTTDSLQARDRLRLHIQKVRLAIVPIASLLRRYLPVLRVACVADLIQHRLHL